ncbi:unnamed protein product [Mytilus coruscus]|uniref:Integrase catalytic domain-containing protein n=1 Tax=Mytilus coruscus TaxID=42192 RepID=A0A6J7ZWE2_MYTCO|nr:unnamed protein product [Mytilus coruscus]
MFGGGTRLKSVGEYDLPMCMVGGQVKLKIGVVDSDIPLLLSRSAMKKEEVKMDLENDTAIIIGKEVSLNLTSSGHYCIPIDKTETLKVEDITMSEKVTIDLKQYKDRWILHMIDIWSTYTVSIFINRKKPTNVIEALMKNWVGIFGVMGALMSDNGGEFSSDEMREVASILNVKVCSTARMSPYQDGLCERVHAITDIVLIKLEAENKKVESGSLLSWQIRHRIHCKCGMVSAVTS